MTDFAAPVRILMDHQPYAAQAGPDQTVQQLAEEIAAEAGKTGRMVSSVSCDGEQIPQERLDEVLGRQIGEFQSIEVQTHSLAALTRAALQQTIALFDDANASRCRAADLLDQGQQEPAMHQLQQFFAAWRQVQESMLVCAHALNVDLETTEVEGQCVADIFTPIKEHLDSLRQAMIDRDFVVVADVLRYELEAPLTAWLALLRHLMMSASSTSPPPVSS